MVCFINIYTTDPPTHQQPNQQMNEPSDTNVPVAGGEDGDGDDDRHDVENQFHRGEVERHGPVHDPARDDEEGDDEDRDLLMCCGVFSRLVGGGVRSCISMTTYYYVGNVGSCTKTNYACVIYANLQTLTTTHYVAPPHPHPPA